MKYTIHNNFVEQKIEQDITSIKEKVIRERKKWGIISLILYGGFAKGEGSVEKEGENIRPLNDYDFLAVSRHPLPGYLSFRRFVQELDSEAQGYKVDMIVRPLWFMKRPHPSVFYYELKNSGKVLWGEDVLSLMPRIPSESIPVYDGVCTLFNRLMSLMEAYGVEDKKLVIYQCNKAVLSSMEILLLLSKKYHWSYRERLAIFKSIFEKSFPQLYRDYPEFIKMAEKATQFKLCPDYSLYPEEDLWEGTVHLYFRILEKMKEMGTAPIFSSATVPNFFKTILSWLVFKLRKRDLSWRFSLRYQPYILTYLAGYEWLKAWVDKAPSYKVRKYLKLIDRVEYTDDFLVLKDKIINNWKKSSFIL